MKAFLLEIIDKSAFTSLFEKYDRITFLLISSCCKPVVNNLCSERFADFLKLLEVLQNLRKYSKLLGFFGEIFFNHVSIY